MPIMNWSENLSVGIVEIDAQHKNLLAQINQLHDSMKEGKGKEALGKTLDELVTYTAYHFKTEERFFLKFAYPDTPAHKKEHDDLTKKAVDLKDKYSKGQMVLTIEVMNFLKDWLTNHIMVSDKKYAPFLKAKGLN